MTIYEHEGFTFVLENIYYVSDVKQTPIGVGLSKPSLRINGVVIGFDKEEAAKKVKKELIEKLKALKL